jgi:hypothetical protein
MKKNYIIKLGASALVLTLITTCLMGSTLARYVSQVTGTATAKVAAWSFRANGEEAAMAAIDLGDTTNRTAYDGTDIKEGVIAPGTTGSFEIELDGTGSEVGIEYSLAVATADGITLPDDFTFSIENAPYTLGHDKAGTIDYSTAENAMKKSIVVDWEWAFDENDSASSNDNIYAGETWTLNITTLGKQAQPAVATAP